MRSTEFINLYKELEDELEAKYSGKKRRHSSVIFEYINSYESAPVRESLNICREIRNLITHNANVGGVPVIEPSEPMLTALKEALEYVRRPTLALDLATPGNRVVSAGLSDKVLKVMSDMEKSGYSHIPILDKKRFVGVFSVSTVFSCILRDPTLRFDSETTIRDLSEMLPLENHMENYAFVDRDTTSVDVRRMFERIKGKNKRLSVIFITQGNEPLFEFVTISIYIHFLNTVLYFCFTDLFSYDRKDFVRILSYIA